MDGLGPRIKQLRLHVGLSKAALARRVGVSDVTISYWESGTIKQIGHERLVSLTSALDCSLKQLLDEDSMSAIASTPSGATNGVMPLSADLPAPWERQPDSQEALSTVQLLMEGGHLVTPVDGEAFEFLSEGDLAAIVPSESFQRDGLYLVESQGRLNIQYLERLASGRMRVSGEQLEGASVESIRTPPFRMLGYVRARWRRQT